MQTTTYSKRTATSSQSCEINYNCEIVIIKNHRTAQSTLRQAVQASRPNVISPLTNDSSTAATTEATSQANYPQIITSILSGQTTNS